MKLNGTILYYYVSDKFERVLNLRKACYCQYQNLIFIMISQEEVFGYNDNKEQLKNEIQYTYL